MSHLTPHRPTPHEENNTALDQILLSHLNAPEEHLRPSSGFAHSVMSAISQEAAVPPPIPFPWKRAIPGAIATLCSLLVLLIYAAHRSIQTAGQNLAFPTLGQLSLTNEQATVCSIILAVSLTLAAISLSFRLVSGRR